jgi:carbamoyltransferase
VLVLGVNPGENASAAFVVDGVLRFAVEEERFVGCKHVQDFPVHAIQAGLDHLGVRLRDVDRIAVGWEPRAGLLRRMMVSASLLDSRSTAGVIGRGQGYARLLRDAWMVRRRLEERWPDEPIRASVDYWRHHLAHAASAYWWSGGDATAILTMDGVGEEDTVVLWGVREGRFEVIDRLRFPNSMGHFYSVMTGYLGFDMGDGEGKLMGLAPYGNPRYLDELRKWTSNGNGGFRLDARRLSYAGARAGRFHPEVTRALGPPVDEPSAANERHRDVAASAQAVLEDAVVHMVRRFEGRVPARVLALSGGVALNCCCNGRLYERTQFSRIHVEPAPTDAGTAVGAAMLSARDAGDSPSIPDPVFLGSRDDARIPDHLPGLRVESVQDPAAVVAQLVADGKIVAVFRDRMEFGPRALGNRSILCSATPAGMKDRVNDGVKFREPFRPFAPAVLAEEAGNYFRSPGPSPYMTFAFSALEPARRLMPATVHVDGTGRLQTVDRQRFPFFHEVLERYRALTGTAGMLNTSLNVRGKPIAATKAEVLKMLADTALDALLADDQLVVKPGIGVKSERESARVSAEV